MLKLNFPPVVARQKAVSDVRVSAVNGTAFVDNLDAFIANNPDYWNLLASGSVTQANSRISAVDGTAFYDFGSGTDLTANLGKYLVVKDSTGKAIKGWIKAAGSGETLEDIITTATLDLTTGWNTIGATIDNSNTFTTSVNFRSVTKDTLIFSALYKISFAASHSDGGSVGVINSSGNLYCSNGDNNKYFSHNISGNGLLYVRNTVSGTTTITTLDLRKVLTPSSTGCTITSTKNGSTFDWESQESGFNYNDASGYTYQVYDRDLSAFCDNSHSISIYDNTGKCLEGVLKEVGSGETVGSDLLAGWDFTSGWFVVSASIIDATSFSTTEAGGVRKLNIVTLLGLYKASLGYNSSTFVQLVGGGASGTYVAGPGVAYHTAFVNQDVYVRNTAGATTEITLLELPQVLTPSASGAVIVNQKGGTTENFRRVDTGFVFNQANYDIIIRRQR